jgi:hypothetical protein
MEMTTVDIFIVYKKVPTGISCRPIGDRIFTTRPEAEQYAKEIYNKLGVDKNWTETHACSLDEYFDLCEKYDKRCII